MRIPILLALALAACSPGNPDVDTGDPPLPFACEADNDGVIDLDELAFPTGVSVPVLANVPGNTVTVDVDGELVAGEPTWDLTDGPSGLSVDLDLIDPAAMWFDDDFPDASWAAPLFAHDTSILGIFQLGDDEVSMLGIASRQASPPEGRTLIVYDDPVDVYRFPLAEGDAWTDETSFRDADIFGIKNQGDESYAFEVDMAGTLVMDGFTFEHVLRIRVESTQTFAVSQGEAVSSIQYLYVRECFGELARIVSLADETELSFTEASEVRRLDVGAVR